MINLKYKGIYKNENQLLNGVLNKDAIMFEEPNNITGLFLRGFLLTSPFFALLIVISYIKIQSANLFSYYFIKENFSTIIIISSLISVLTLFMHEILHALTFPFKSVKELWIKPNEMAAFIYCNAPLKKSKFIWICLCPNVILGAFPYMLWLIGVFDFNETLSLYILILSFLNLSIGIGDYYNVYLTIKQVPNNSYIQNYGFHSYWFR